MWYFYFIVKSSRTAGRPAVGESAWDAYIARSDEMRRISLSAKAKGMSMDRFSKLAGRDRKQVVDSLNAKQPRHSTIEVYAKDALELPVIARRALMNRMTDRDVEDVVREIAYTGMIKLEEIAAASNEARSRAARMLVLSANHLDEQVEPLIAFWDALEPKASQVSVDVLASRAARHSGNVPDRVLDYVDRIYQRVPAARRFTWVDENQFIDVLAEVLEDYVWSKGVADENRAPFTSSRTPELADLKIELGRRAEASSQGKPVPKYDKNRKKGPQ